jgi:hypothetical protein
MKARMTMMTRRKSEEDEVMGKVVDRVHGPARHNCTIHLHGIFAWHIPTRHDEPSRTVVDPSAK